MERLTYQYKYFIEGAGGGKSGGSGAKEAPNTLRVNTRVRFIGVISHGRIVTGPIDGSKSIYLDDVPLQNPDDSYNANGFAWTFRPGDIDQDVIPGQDGAESEVSIEQKVIQSTPVSVTITEPDTNAVRVYIALPYLAKQNNKTGDLETTDVSYAIDVKTNTGSFVQVHIENLVKQKTTSRVEKMYRVELPPGGHPWTVRVRRITADSASANLSNETWFSRYAKIVDGKFNYGGWALFGAEADLQSFGSSLPNITVDVPGRDIAVPTNYDPVTKVYATTGPGTSGGIWDGTFKNAATENTAWILYDLAINNVFGLGEILNPDNDPGATFLDKWAFYELARYCDEEVPDGRGGMESRFRTNTQITSSEEAYDLLQQIASSMNAMLYWSENQIKITHDHPMDAEIPVTNADVVKGEFNYSGTALKSRHNIAYVSWINPALGWKRDIEVVQDTESINKFGANSVDITAWGCTSQGQARRTGLWALYTEQNQVETVTYNADADHGFVMPGTIIDIYDSDRAGIRFGGRIVGSELLTSPNRTKLIIDQPVELEVGETYKIKFFDDQMEYVEKTVINSAGTTDEIIFNGHIGYHADLYGTLWGIVASNVQPRKYKVLAIVHNEDDTYQVTALSHNENKWAEIEQGITLEDPPTSLIPTGVIAPPTNLTTVQWWEAQSGAEAKARLTVSYIAPANDPRAVKYEIEMLSPSEAWLQIYDGPRLSADTPVVRPNDTIPYYFRIRSKDAKNRVSDWVISSPVYVLGNNAPPNAPTAFSAVGAFDSIALSWATPVDTPDFKHVEIWRHTSNTLGSATKIAEIPGTSFIDENLGTGTQRYYWLRTVTHAQSNNLSSFTSSANATTTAIVLGDLDSTVTTMITDSSSDGVLTPGEKIGIVPVINELINSQSALDTRATALGITTEKTAFDTAMSTLNSYLATLTTPTAWNSQAGNTTIVASTFLTNLQNGFTTRLALQRKIDELNANATVPASTANSIWFSQFEQELTGWAVYDGYALTKTNVFLTGNQKKCYRLNVTFTGNNQFLAIGQDINVDKSRSSDVLPGSRIFVSVGIEVGTTSGGTLSTQTLQVQWFKADGTSSSTPFTDIATSSGNQSFNTKMKGFATVPADAVKATIFVYIANLTSGAGQKWLLITEPMLTQAHSLQTFEPAFVPGPTADTRLVPVGQNRIYNSRMDPDTSGYGAGWDGTVALPVTRGRNLTGTPNRFGARNVMWVAVAGTPANDTIVECHASVGPTGVLSDLRRYACKVEAGDRLYISSLFGFVNFKNAYLVVTFGDSTGAYVTEYGTGAAALTAPGGADNGVSMQRQGGFVTVPAGAHYAWLRARFTANGSGLNPTGFWSEPFLAVVPATQTIAPAFTHGEIARGAIVDAIPPTEQISNTRIIGSDANRVCFSEGERPDVISLQVTALPSGVTGIGVTSVTNSGRKGYRITFTTDGAKAPAMRMGWAVAHGARINPSERFVASLVAVPGSGVTAAAGFNEFNSSGVSNGFASIASVAGGFAGQKYAQIITAQPTSVVVCLYVRLDVGAAGTYTCDIFEPLVTGTTPDQTALPGYSVGINATNGADVTRQNPAGGLITGATQQQSDGTQRLLPYGVLEKWLEDGESWTFPTAFATTPKAKSIQGGKRTSTGLTGDQVQADSFVVTPTGLTASLKNKELVGSPTTQTQNTWSNISSVRRDAHKPTSADAFDNSYKVTFSLDLYAPFDWYNNDIPYPGETVYYGEAVVTVYTDDGGGRVARGSTVLSYGDALPGAPYGNPSSVNGTVTGEITFTAPAIGQHAGLEFSVEITSRDHTSTVFNGSNSATYKTATAPASASRTTANEKVLVRVEAGQEL